MNAKPLVLSMCLSFGLAAAAGNGPVGGQAPQAPAGVDPTRLGPQVGETVPAFSLPDQHGTVRTSRSLMGPKGMMLVFNRATAW